jgi:hypothetical protein
MKKTDTYHQLLHQVLRHGGKESAIILSVSIGLSLLLFALADLLQVIVTSL